MAGEPLSAHLRPPEAALLFPATGQLLLLSEREAEQLQALVAPRASVSCDGAAQARSGLRSHALADLGPSRAAGNGETGAAGEAEAAGWPLLLSLGFAAAAWSQPDRTVPLVAQLPPPGRAPLDGAAAGQALRRGLSADALVSAQLWAGEASYPGLKLRAALRALVWRRGEAVAALLAARGRAAALARSDLERAAWDLAEGASVPGALLRGAGWGAQQSVSAWLAVT